MSSRDYENFDLLIESVEGGGYRALVTESPLDETPSVRFTMPFDATRLENLLLKLDPGRSGTRRVASDPQSKAAQEFGVGLFDAVFHEDILLAWERSLDAVGRERGLRLRLRLNDAAALAGLPWELLNDRRGRGYLAQSEQTPVVRFIDLPQPPRPLAVGGALQILAVIASPTNLPTLDVEAEWAGLKRALADPIATGTVRLDRLEQPSMSELAKWLRTNTVHVLHFVGHGAYDVQHEDGVIYMCDKYGRSSAVSSAVLGPYSRDHLPLRLIVLNACHTARIDSDDPFSGMAQSLVRQDTTAVVAMQFPISDDAAAAFSSGFYGALADGLPIDQAATAARKGLIADFATEWATPVLFLRAPDGKVFADIIAVPPVVLPDPEPEPVLEQDPEEPPPADDPPSGGEAPTVVETRRPRRTPPLAMLVGSGALVVAFVLGGSWLFARAGDNVAGPTPSPTAPSPTSAGTASSTTNTTASSAPTPAPTLRLSEPGVRIAAQQFESPPVLDGDPTEWATVPVIVADTVVYPVGGGDSTIAGRWQLGWDRESLYFFVDVVDPQVTQLNLTDNSQLYKGDGVGFEIGAWAGKVSRTILPGRDLNVLFGITDGEERPTVIAGINSAKGTDFVRQTDLTVNGVGVMTPAGYRIEAAVPWERLNVTGVKRGLLLTMNLTVSDGNADTAGLRTMVSNNPLRTRNSAPGRYQWGQLTLK